MSESLVKAYKRGYQDFYGRDFVVSPDVLIPRPETEAIVDEVKLLAGQSYLPGMKAQKQKLSENPLILDVGTGSGCIAITLKLEIKEAEVVGLDVSSKALRIARENAEKLGASVDFVGSDLLCNYRGKVPDVIVANLPYVDENWEWLDKEALSKEPELALYATNGGLDLIFGLINQAKMLWQNDSGEKWLILEADPCQHQRIIKYATERGISHLKTNDFILVLCKPQE
ncbi:HemK family protein methyltransferase [Candidatus Saccharibacteria bacterium]|nr:HemK family protein methyltransferase [Candidatus Saccharibacteria bacterium]